jgi:hypothetical protein
MAKPIFIFHWTYGVCTAFKVSLTWRTAKIVKAPKKIAFQPVLNGYFTPLSIFEQKS